MSTLYIVATPIGNLEDITLRALRVLGEVGVVFAEDTRQTKKLLMKHSIETPVERYDEHSHARVVEKVLSCLRDGSAVALVSDAGTPAINDPGARLVGEVRKAGYEVVAIPGPSALTAALSIAGVPADEFVFLGFPPHKKGRETFFKRLAAEAENRTVVFYESPHRIMKALEQLEQALSAYSREYADKEIVIARELTKIHEEVLEGTASELLGLLEEQPEKQKGEFVVICSPKATSR